MKDDKYLWAWVGGTAALIVLVLGLWWWRAGRLPAQGEVGYDTAMLGSEALQGPNAPTLPVPVVPLPAAIKHVRVGVKPDTTVVGVIAGLPEASRFAVLLKNTGVAGMFSGTGPITVFVPENKAFALLPPGALDLTSTQLKRLVEYHAVKGKGLDVNAEYAGTEQALSGDMLNFSVLTGDQSARINSAVALKEYKASNGIVYVVSEVLLPPVNPQ